MAEEENEEKISTLEKMIALSPFPYFGEKAMYKWKYYNALQTSRNEADAKIEAIGGTVFSRIFVYGAYLVIAGMFYS